MNKPVRYAEQYTEEERNRIFRRYAIAIVLIVAVFYFLLLPEIESFMHIAHCQTIAGYNGLIVLVYGMFTGLPLLFAVIIQSVLSWQAYRIIRDRQAPPKDVRVFSKTRVLAGRDAIVKAVFLVLIIPALFTVVFNYSLLQAEQMLQSIDLNQLDYSLCVKMYDENL